VQGRLCGRVQACLHGDVQKCRGELVLYAGVLAFRLA
jgi:hypothetical protein